MTGQSHAAESCDYCGLLDWTVREYGRVTHKQSCPHRTEPWHQGDPDPDLEPDPDARRDWDRDTAAIDESRRHGEDASTLKGTG